MAWIKGAKKIKNELNDRRFHVVIFGSARIKRGDKNYKLVYDLAKRIGMEGIDIITGGGPGLMNAATMGHKFGKKQTGAVSVGLTIHLPSRRQEANQHIDLREDFWKFSDRLDTFMELADAVVVAPGGVGTLLELFYTWQLVQVKEIKYMPIILLGDMWPDLIKWVENWPLKSKLLNKEDMGQFFLAKDCDEAMQILRFSHAHFVLRGESGYRKHQVRTYKKHDNNLVKTMRPLWYKKEQLLKK